MKLSARAEYAVRAMYELAKGGPREAPLTVSAIAQSQSIPPNFLTQLFLRLHHAGLVKSVRGSGGGYLLAAPPASIRVLDIIQAVDKLLLEKHFHEGRKPATPAETSLAQVLLKLDSQVESALEVDLETLIMLGEGTPVNYQI